MADRRGKIMGTKTVHTQLWDLSSNSRFHALIWQFWKSARISKTAHRRAKISLISTPWSRKRAHMQLWDASSNSICHSQIFKFWKWARILKKPRLDKIGITSMLPLLFYTQISLQILNLPANSVFYFFFFLGGGGGLVNNKHHNVFYNNHIYILLPFWSRSVCYPFEWIRC